MGELSDVFGEDFEEQYEQETQRRRQQQNEVEKDTVKAICYEAVQGEGFDGDTPRFTYEGSEVPHDVLLMKTYDGDLGKFKNSFKNGGMSLGMFHMDKLMSCAFNEDKVDIIDKINPDTYYIVIGKYEEKTTMKDGTKETYYNVNPVRGIVPLPQAKDLAAEYEQNKGQSSVEEQQEDQGTADGSDSESGSEDEHELIVKVFNAVSGKKPTLLEDVAEGDADALEKLTGLVDKNVPFDVDESDVYESFEEEVAEIDDEEEEEDDLDVGLDDDDIDLDDDSSDSDDTDDGDSEGSDEDSDSSDSDDSDDESESPEDWF